MTVALFGPDAELLNKVAADLAGEGVEACPFAPPDAARMRELGDGFHKAVLVFLKHGAGAATGNVKRLLGDGRDLILCAKLLDAKDRELLTDPDEGASKVIAPRSPKAEHVAERILAQLILDGEVQPASCPPLHGATRAMRRVYEQIESYARIPDPVLITGESGTGKELVAQALHRLSVAAGRQDKLIPINCGDLDRELAASELFGHKKGSFTGAVGDRKGMIAEAGRGTSFLDEFGELELSVQSKLLRVLEDFQVKPVGSNEYVKVHARILLATNRNLEKECVEGGRFRKDLYWRIRGFHIELPPLRDRRADIPLLARHFLALWNEEQRENDKNKKDLEIPDDAFDCLFDDDWAGNLRGLRDAVRTAATNADFCGSRYVHPQPKKSEFERKAEPAFGKGFVIYCDPTAEKYQDFVKRARLSYIHSLLKATGGNRTKAIDISGLHHSQFYEYLKEPEPDEE